MAPFARPVTKTIGNPCGTGRTAMFAERASNLRSTLPRLTGGTPLYACALEAGLCVLAMLGGAIAVPIAVLLASGILAW
jgi:hypothetical protein